MPRKTYHQKCHQLYLSISQPPSLLLSSAKQALGAPIPLVTQWAPFPVAGAHDHLPEPGSPVLQGRAATGALSQQSASLLTGRSETPRVLWGVHPRGCFGYLLSQSATEGGPPLPGCFGPKLPTLQGPGSRPFRSYTNRHPGNLWTPTPQRYPAPLLHSPREREAPACILRLREKRCVKAGRTPTDTGTEKGPRGTVLLTTHTRDCDPQGNVTRRFYPCSQRAPTSPSPP